MRYPLSQGGVQTKNKTCNFEFSEEKNNFPACKAEAAAATVFVFELDFQLTLASNSHVESKVNIPT
jgi:hypothetical protein